MEQKKGIKESVDKERTFFSHKDLQQSLEKLTASTFSFEHIVQEKDANKRAELLDRVFHANLGQMTTGLSPAALMIAYTDWCTHLALSPNKQWQLMQSACTKWGDFCSRNADFLTNHTKDCFDIKDKRFHERFQHESWQKWPYCAAAQFFMEVEDWWQEVMHIRGIEKNHQDLTSFIHSQWLNALSPENYIWTNPVIQEKIQETQGQNLIDGWQHCLEDVQRYFLDEPPVGTEQFIVGENVAVTPGKIVFRNHFFELIQYAPQTQSVYSEPVLIIPAWIMKYYILDLSPDNSMVDYLVKKGHTVFMISWKNPDASYRDYCFEDYLKSGVLKAIDVALTITKQKKLHTAGYCIGGTALAMSAAYLARHGHDLLRSMTLFAAQTDFEKAGELMTFIDQNQLCYLEDIMFCQGYLKGGQMSSTFDLLRSKELVWSKVIERYLLGERQPMIDLLAWNADTTRLSYKMHSEYLRHFHLNNDLAEGDYQIDGEPVVLGDIKIPVFSVATEKDHIAPWESVYKLHLFAHQADITFVLANKGHNGGIISEPGHPGRRYRIGKKEAGEKYISPKAWHAKHHSKEGSWWPAWHQWLAHQSVTQTTPPDMGALESGFAPLEDAPGSFVKER